MMNRIDGERNLFESQFNESNNMIYTPPSILSSRRSIQLPVTSPRQNLSPFSDEDKISVDVMRRLTTFDNTKLLDFVGWLNTKEDNIKNNFNNDNTSSTTNNRPCRGNSIPNYTSNQSTNYNLYHSDSLNYSSSSKSSSDSSNGLFGLIKNKISINNDTNRRSSNNIIPSDKKKFRAASITGGRVINNNFAALSKKCSLQNNSYNNGNDNTKDRRKSLANFRSKSNTRRPSNHPERNLL